MISTINTRRKPWEVWQIVSLIIPLLVRKKSELFGFFTWEVNCILEKDKMEKLFSDGFVSWHYKFFEDSCHESL